MKKINSTLRPSLDWQRLKFIALWVFGFGLVAHGYCFFNTNLSHDSLYSIYEESPFLMLSAGRYGRVIYRLFRGNFTLPALNGFLLLCYLSCTVYLLSDILPIRKKSFLALTCGILTVNSTVCLMSATFLHDSDAYGFALLLAVLGAWIALNCHWGAVLCIPFYTFSLSIYQAFINVVIYLWLFLALMALLEGKPVGKVLGSILTRMLPVAASMVLYYLGHRLILLVTGIDVIDYAAVNTLHPTLAGILSNVRAIWEAEREWFLQPLGDRYGLLRLGNVVLALVSLYALVVLGLQRKLSFAAWLTALGLLLVMPLGMDAVGLISEAYHEITLYALFLTYPLMLSLAERYLESPGKPMVSVLCTALLAVLLFDSCLYSNTVYLKKELDGKQTLSLYTRILNRMEQTEGYVTGETPVVIVGDPAKSVLNTTREGFDTRGVGLRTSLATTYYATMQKYMTYYLGAPVHFGGGDIQWQINNSQEMFDMPMFPEPGSVKMIDGIMVVKLTPPEGEIGTN